MNATSRDVQIFEPFGRAFELMKRILFQPFDFAKWCGIGFAAFLAGHFGGGGFSPPIPLGNFSNQGINYDPEYLPWLIGLVVALVLLFFAFIIFVIWIRSRGIFILTDCIVRNRAAIKEPWQEYRKEGNSFFKFSLVVMVLCVFFFALIAAVFLGIAFAVPEHWRVIALVSVTALTMLVWVSVCFAFALINYFMPMIMYAQRCGATQALRQAVNLILDNPLAFALFAGFAIVLFFAFVIVSTTVTCATCCLASLPYVGTVIMLPAFVWIRGFGLLFLRQFGPEFDVWREIPPTLPPPITPPLPA